MTNPKNLIVKGGLLLSGLALTTLLITPVFARSSHDEGKDNNNGNSFFGHFFNGWHFGKDKDDALRAFCTRVLASPSPSPSVSPEPSPSPET